MARVFMSGCEGGSDLVFTLTFNIDESTAQKRTGAYSFLAGSTSTYAQQTLPAALTELYLRIGIYPVQFGSTCGMIVRFASPTDTVQAVLTANKLTNVLQYCLGNNTPVLAGTHPLLLNTWQCIEIYYKVADAPDGRFTVKLDGVTDITFSGDTRNTDATVQRVRFMGDGTSATGTQAYFDDIAINDTAGALNNSWIGRGGIYPIFPDLAATYTDLHASVGNGWDCINEVPPSDTDYVYDEVVDQKSTYRMTDLTPTTGTIAAINVIMRAKLDAAGVGSIARLIRSNAVDSQGADVPLDTSARTITEIIETDPGAAPGTLWTIARVNALEAGAVVR